jgi:hypothetical protein
MLSDAPHTAQNKAIFFLAQNVSLQNTRKAKAPCNSEGTSIRKCRHGLIYLLGPAMRR